MIWLVPVQRGPDVPRGPVDRCIYCGKSPKERELEAEHVLPRGLYGNLKLLDASCRPCAEIIHAYEKQVINGNFGLLRTAEGIYSNKRRGAGQKRNPPDPEMPHLILAVGFNTRASVLTGDDPKTRSLKVDISRPRLGRANGTGDWINFQTRMDNLGYLRFIAKVAHGYAVDALGYGSFKPYLLDLICEGRWQDLYRFLGQRPEKSAKSLRHLHKMECKVMDQTAYLLPGLPGIRRQLVVVTISLFTNHWDYPAYEVVVGEIVNPT